MNSILPGGSFECAVAPVSRNLAGTLNYLAGLKNVCLSPTQAEGALELAERCLVGPGLASIDFSDVPTADPATRVIDRVLDILAAWEVMNHVAALIEGNVSPEPRAQMLRAAEMVERFTKGASFYRWPPSMETFDLHYAEVPWAPIVTNHEDGSVTTSYMRGGMLHRDPAQGPAVTHRDHDGQTMFAAYMKDGQLHRDSRDGPAVIDSNVVFEGRKIRKEEYFCHGKRHRPPHEGAAILYYDGDNRCIREVYFDHGVKHRDPNEGPALWGYEDGLEILEYEIYGELHREENYGPATLRRDLATGVIVDEQYCSHGVWHRVNGPAVTTRDSEGRVKGHYWYQDGQFHRDAAEGPAVTETDCVGAVIRQEYWLNGERVDTVPAAKPNRGSRRKAKSASALSGKNFKKRRARHG